MTHPRLNEREIHAWLALNPAWDVRDGKLQREFIFSDFEAAFAWMTRVADVAEAMNHHPEWLNVYARVEVALITHDSGGLTQLDLNMAQAMDDALSKR